MEWIKSGESVTNLAAELQAGALRQTAPLGDHTAIGEPVQRLRRR